MMAGVAADHATENAGSANPTPAAETSAAMQPAAGATAAPEGGAQAMIAPGARGPGDILLPDMVAYVPAPNPENPFAAAMPALEAENAPSGDGLPAVALIPAPNPVESGQIPVPVDIPADAANASTQATAYAETAASPTEPKKRGFFASLFAPSDDHAIVAKASADEHPQRLALLDEGNAKPLIDTDAPARPVLETASAGAASATHRSAANDQLPGVRSGNSLFEITRKSGGGDNSDVDINEEGAAPVVLASAGGMARLDPHGLILQRDTVDTACLRPALLAVLKKIERHYGRKLVVTSGYRSRVHNAAARGARNSLHMYCAAADVQMPGVSKWELAAYARSMPGRGGVGTYCYTKSVHIDIGPERDWNWRCRRKRHRHG
jgi:uncharacterized protein YcbK (DUF882 family)